MKIEFKFTMEAGELDAQKKLTKLVMAKLREKSEMGHFTFIRPVDVTEGAEKCGYGKLHIELEVKQLSHPDPIHWVVENNRSQWRNYGAPHGTKYDIEFSLVEVSTAATFMGRGPQ